MAHRDRSLGRELVIAAIWLAFAAGAASLAYQAMLWLTGRIH